MFKKVTPALVVTLLTMMGCSCAKPDLASNLMPVSVSELPRGQNRLSWSPDGARIAFADFVSTTLTTSPYSGYWQIHVMDTDGSHVQQLTTSAANNDSPIWSPDGKKIAFVSDYTEIYMMDTSGSHIERLTYCADNARLCSDPSWSPDGKRIAFASQLHDDTADVDTDIYVVDIGDSSFQQLTDWGWCVSPAWSPDGERIAFVYDGGAEEKKGIYTISVDSYTLTRLTTKTGIGLAWSPDGAYLAFVSDDICVLEVDTLALSCSASDLGPPHHPTWSPSGQKIAFESSLEGKGLYVVDVDDLDHPRLLVQSAGGYPAWSPDGKRIAFHSSGNACTGIATAGPDGTDFSCIWSRP
jgi:Tol biopolymer transport system component